MKKRTIKKSKYYLRKELKLIYLLLLNPTMILRSIGKKYSDDGIIEEKRKKKVDNFKKKLFWIITPLVNKMDNGILKDKDIIKAIKDLRTKTNISIG